MRYVTKFLFILFVALKGAFYWVNIFGSWCLKWLPAASMHAFKRLRTDRTARSIGSCGSESQMFCRTALSSRMFCGLGVCFSYLSNMAPQTWKSNGLRSGEFGGHWSLLINAGQFCSRYDCVTWAVCAGAPSCWKMKSFCRRVWLSFSSFGSSCTV